MDVNGISSLYGSTQDPLRDPTRVLGKDDFLRLLTVQLQHQDPLTPMENQDLIAQLAQFSSLEQLENINANLQSSMDLDLILTQVLNNTAAAGLIGKTVVAKGGAISLDSSNEVEMNFDLASAAGRVVVTVLDDTGAIVRMIEQQDVGAGRNQLIWNGLDNDGRNRGEGSYRFRVEAYDAEGESIEATPLVMGEISGVKFENGEAVFMIGNLEVGIGEILELTTKDEA
jgi:flagellar basal-body rod modification protein FlgD